MRIANIAGRSSLVPGTVALDVEVALSGDRVDWEAEPVMVIGRAGHDLDDLRIHREVTDPDGSTRALQDGSTGSMLFRVPQPVERLSAVVELRPGDLVFTGTPAGVGIRRSSCRQVRS